MEINPIFNGQRNTWKRKKVLREIYLEWFKKILEYCASGEVSLELGGGPGFLKERFRGIICSDIIPSPWLDLVCDAHHLPFSNNSIDNVILLDVFHHLQKPDLFMGKVSQAIRPGGRIIMLEPWISPFSFLVYKFFHQEQCNFMANRKKPLQSNKTNKNTYFQGDSAVPFLYFNKRNKEVEKGLRIILIERKICLAYLLTFGFKRINVLPVRLKKNVDFIERMLEPLVSILAIRALIVLEKSSYEK